MHIAYLAFDAASALAQMNRKELMKLWNRLVLQAGGDVQQALEWLKYLWERYQLTGGTMSFEEFRQFLEDQSLIARGDLDTDYVLTPRGERGIRQDSLDQVFGSLKNAGSGNHRTPRHGEGGDPLSDTRPFQPGDLSSDIDYSRSIRNALKRHNADADGFDLREADLEVFEKEHFVSCATVLMIDLSHSMILYGEDRITPAKRTAIALAELIKTRYPKDSLEVVVFGDDAWEVKVAELPYLKVGPFHTNTKAGLRLAQRLLARKKQTNRQIFMITDGKPSVIFEDGQMYRNSFGLDPLIVNRTLEEAAACRRKGIQITTFMVAADQILVNFVDQLTHINEGRAYFSSLDDLGGYLFVDYLKNRRRRVR